MGAAGGVAASEEEAAGVPLVVAVDSRPAGRPALGVVKGMLWGVADHHLKNGIAVLRWSIVCWFYRRAYAAGNSKGREEADIGYWTISMCSFALNDR